MSRHLSSRVIATALMVSGLLLGTARESAAVTYTWRTGAPSGNATNWNNAANWVGNAVPVTNNGLAFTSNTVASSIAPNNNLTFTATSLEFSGTTAYQLDGSPLTMSSGAFIDNQASVLQRISSGLALSGNLDIFNGPGSSLQFDSNSITGSGTVTLSGQGITNLNTNASGATLFFDAGKLQTGNATVTVGGVNTTQNGTAPPSNLNIRGTSIGALNVNGNYTGGPTLTTVFTLSGTDNFDTINVSGTTSFGNQQLSLDFAGLATLGTVADRGTSFPLFAGASSYVGNIGGISSVGTGDYASLGPWYLENGSYRSTATFGPDNNYFYFNQSTGSLMVVPEPSALVIAGVGVALAGWRMARRRKGGKPSA